MANAQRAAAIAQQIIDQHISGVHAVLLKKKTSDELRAEMARNTAQMNELTDRNDVLVRELAKRGLKAVEPPAAMPTPPLEYTLHEVVRKRPLSPWAVAVAVDSNGAVCEYECVPTPNPAVGGVWLSRVGRTNRINKVVPPLNFRNCIFEVPR